MKESEQVRFENMRSLLDDKTRKCLLYNHIHFFFHEISREYFGVRLAGELMQLQKQLKQHIARLVSSLSIHAVSRLFLQSILSWCQWLVDVVYEAIDV